MATSNLRRAPRSRVATTWLAIELRWALASAFAAALTTGVLGLTASARAQEPPVQEPAAPAPGTEAGTADEAGTAEEAGAAEEAGTAVSATGEAAPALRVHLRWESAASLRLEMVGPGGVPVDPRGAAVLSGDAAEGPSGAWLEWPSEPPAGPYLICALGDAGAGTRVTVEVQRDGRTGTRDYTVAGRLGRPCTRQARGFLLGVAIGSGPAVTPPGPQAAPEPEPTAACTEGREPVDGGYCCWPGQDFDLAVGRCTGPPRCPSGFAAAGADCQRRADTTSAGMAATSGTGFEVTASGGTHIDAGLAVAGSIVIGLGYASSVIFGILGDNFILLIPVVGGLIHAPLNGTEGGILLGISVSAVQIAGLILLVAGVAANHPNEPAEAGLEPALVPGPGEAGLGLRWRF